MAAASNQLTTSQSKNISFQLHCHEEDPYKLQLIPIDSENPQRITRLAFDVFRSLTEQCIETLKSGMPCPTFIYAGHNSRSIETLFHTGEALSEYLEKKACYTGALRIDSKSVHTPSSITCNHIVTLIKLPAEMICSCTPSSTIQNWVVEKFILLDTPEGTKLCIPNPISTAISHFAMPVCHEYTPIASLGFTSLLIKPLPGKEPVDLTNCYQIIDLNPRYNMNANLSEFILSKANDLAVLLLKGNKEEYKIAIQSIYNGSTPLLTVRGHPMCVPISKYALPAYWIKYFLQTWTCPDIDLINELVQADPYWQQLGIASIHPDTIKSTIEAYRNSLNPFMGIIPSSYLHVTNTHPPREVFETLELPPKIVRTFDDEATPPLEAPASCDDDD